MEQSKEPKDVLELGHYLASELGVYEGVDTLGRWMAHYLAELIDKAENSPNERDRKTARQEATDTILKIWEHRKSLPGNVYPLERFKDIFLVLDHLLPANDPFSNFRGEKIDQLSSALFTGTARLIPLLLLMKAQKDGKLSAVDPVVMESLDEREQYLLTTIYYWMQLFLPDGEIYEQAVERDGTKTDAKTASLESLAIEVVAELASTLKGIEKELKFKCGGNI